MIRRFTFVSMMLLAMALLLAPMSGFAQGPQGNGPQGNGPQGNGKDDDRDDRDQGNKGKVDCSGLPGYAILKAALNAAVNPQTAGGFNLEMWGTIVNRDGEVCEVAFTGKERGDQWPGSRVISAQKANTANAFSLPHLALSTANLYSATQPGGSLFGLQESNPVNVAVAYRGSPSDYGRPDDPMVGGKIGGVNVFGGGLALYNSRGVLLGGIGVSGDSSCADHIVAWRVRNLLRLDFVPAGVVNGTDNMVNDITLHAPNSSEGASASGWGHPECSATSSAVTKALPTTNPIGRQVR